MQIPALSIIFMSVSAIISIGTPIAVFLYFRKKFDSKIFPMILGLIGFAVFVLILESLVHNIVIDKIIFRDRSPALFIVYGVLMAGIFEETARLIAFKILKKKYEGISTALSYGIGHGGLESILLAGVSLIFAIILSILLNTGNIDLITGKMTGAALDAINRQIETMRITAPYVFLFSGMERICAIGIQLSLSVIMFYAVFGNKKLWLYPVAILCHAIIDVPAAAMQAGVIKSIPLVESIVLVSAVLIIIYARYLHCLLADK